MFPFTAHLTIHAMIGKTLTDQEFFATIKGLKWLSKTKNKQTNKQTKNQNAHRHAYGIGKTVDKH